MSEELWTSLFMLVFVLAGCAFFLAMLSEARRAGLAEGLRVGIERERRACWAVADRASRRYDQLRLPSSADVASVIADAIADRGPMEKPSAEEEPVRLKRRKS